MGIPIGSDLGDERMGTSIRRCSAPIICGTVVAIVAALLLCYTILYECCNKCCLEAFKYNNFVSGAWSNIIVPIGSSVDRNIDHILGWPVAAIIITIFILRSSATSEIFSNIAGSVRSFNAFGVSVELDKKFRILDREQRELSSAVLMARKGLKDAILEESEKQNIDTAFSELTREIFDWIKGKDQKFLAEKCRSTIHIPDPIFDGYLRA